MHRFVIVFMMALLLVILVFGANLVVFVHTPNHQEAREIHIEKGRAFSDVVHLLRKEGVITNEGLFESYVMLSRMVGKIRAGDYRFPAGVSPREVLKMLRKGDFERIRVTLIEGWTLREVARSLSAYVNEQDFLRQARDPQTVRDLGLSEASLEGYLFPDTYEIYRPRNSEELLRKFVRHFQEVYEKEFASRADQLGMSLHDVVALASVIEKETGRGDEAPLIASVFFNRLKLNIPLASDPTVIYGLENFSGNLTRQDLERPGPYNTYLNTGLPPAPISNPGRVSIQAALFPAQTDYLYFVARGDGTHEFSKTAEEHQRAVYKYQILHQVPSPPTGTSETAPSSRP